MEIINIEHVKSKSLQIHAVEVTAMVGDDEYRQSYDVNLARVHRGMPDTTGMGDYDRGAIETCFAVNLCILEMGLMIRELTKGNNVE